LGKMKDRIRIFWELLSGAIRLGWRLFMDSFSARWRLVIIVLAAFIFSGLGFLIGLYFYFSHGLPQLSSLEDYKPMINTEIYTDDGTMVYELAEEYRKVVPLKKIPRHLVNAFLAVEDARFYQHGGLDFYRLAGALVHDVMAMKAKEGGSTITMQLARSFFLTRKKLVSRKLREMILARRIDNSLKKDEILELYLNQIYLGQNAYGVEAAAEKYFSKSVDQLTLAESAILAAIPKSPAQLDPVKHFDKAKQRQRLVFRRMVEEKMLSEQEAELAEKEPVLIKFKSNPYWDDTAYFVESVRRYLVNRYGYDKVYKEGLKVFTSMQLDMQKQAANAVRLGLTGPESIDRKNGYRGPIDKVSKEKITDAAVNNYLAAEEVQLRERWAYLNITSGGDPLAQAPPAAPLEPGTRYRAVVLEVDKKAGKIALGVGASRGLMQQDDFKWAVGYGSKAMDRLFHRGDVILASVIESKVSKTGTEYKFRLEQDPETEAGLIAFSVKSGEIKALVGGYDFGKSQLIRPLQSVRQPGSAFKPIIYGAALEQPTRGYTPATIIFDAPVIYENQTEDGDTSFWTPDNYGGRFSGPRTMRTALERSINTISVKIAERIGVDYAMNFARKLEIKSPFQRDLSMALGTSPLSLLELTRAYNVYASGGYLVEPYMIRRVYDREGNLLEWHHPTKTEAEKKSEIVEMDLASGDTIENDKLKPVQQEVNPIDPAKVNEPGPDAYLVMLREKKIPSVSGMDFVLQGPQVISPQIAYLMTYMLEGVVQRGTGFAASELGRPLAGKTGTTNDFRDAWFVGFSPELIAGVWVGYDDFNRSLGEANSGAKVALPIWIAFMKPALSQRPVIDFPVPENIEFARIDQNTGLLANTCSEKSVMEAFIAGTAPNEYSPCGIVPATDDLIQRLDY